MTDQKETALTVQDLSKQYPSAKYNRLLPSTLIGTISPLQKLSIEVLEIDPNPVNGEVFEVGNAKDEKGQWEKRYSLTKTALDRIAHTLGISWIPEQTRRIDDRSNPRIVEFKAVAILKKTDGTLQILSGTKEIDLDAMEIELMFELEQSAKNGKLKKGDTTLKFGSRECNEYINTRVTKRMIELRKYKVAIAESGAKNRAIRSLGLKSSFSHADLKKPFVVPRIDFNPEVALADPQMRREIIREAMAAGVQLYGVGPAPGNQLPAGNGGTRQDVQEAEYQEEKASEQADSPDGESKEDEPKLTPEEEKAIYLEGLTTEDRVRMIKELAEKKGKKVNPEAVAKKAVTTQIQNIMWLESLPKVEPEPVDEEDDLPF